MAMINKNIDDILDYSNLGPPDKALSNALYGLRHSNVMSPIKSSNDVFGFVFFTRPQLNLRSGNIKNIRQFYPLLNKNNLSIQRYVRVMLDPRLPFQLTVRGNNNNFYNKEIIDTPLVDKLNPFITVLSNSIKTMSGWPDIVAPTWTSNGGMRREQITMIDGTYEFLESFDIDCTFSNYITDPIMLMMQTWIQYVSLTFEGMLSPYWDFVMENEFDYNTRIYRIVMDPTFKIVKRISATGASFPINVPTGKFFDFNRERPYSDQTKDINIRFKCMGALYNDEILIKEFNETIGIFNPPYRSFLKGNKKAMIKIPDNIRDMLNFRGYPYIDMETRRLHWLLPRTSLTYKRIESYVNKLKNKKDNPIDNINKKGVKYG